MDRSVRIAAPGAPDRMTQVSRTGQATVQYEYDAMGRLLRRREDPTGSDDTTISYWLGLTKLAEETWADDTGRDEVVFRPDTESGTDPTANGYYYHSGSGTITTAYATDPDRGKVVKLSTTATGTFPASWMLGDVGYADYNPNDASFFQSGRNVLGLWIRSNNGGNPYQFRVYLYTSDGDLNLDFSTGTGTDYQSGTEHYDFIGDEGAWHDGDWHYLEVNLEERLQQFRATTTVTDVHGFKFMGKELYIDDIILSEGRLGTSWAAVPGAAIGGVLGAQTGHGGANGVAAWGGYYYHYNDLGTVMATTDAVGDMLGVYAPDHFGNYRYVYSTRPDTMGLTGKFFDTASGTYKYNYRDFDSERGRWMSEEPLGLDGPNYYHFTFNNPVNNIDPNGLQTYIPGAPQTQSPYNYNPDIPLPGSGSAPCIGATMNLKVGLDPRNGNPYKHCVWNCNMARECGKAFAAGASLVKEVADLILAPFHQDSANSAFQKSDFLDNKCGRDGADPQFRDMDCEDYCKSRGIGPRTDEGPNTPRPFGPFRGLGPKGRGDNIAAPIPIAGGWF